MKLLKKEFIGRGEVSGFIFKQVYVHDKFYIYQVTDNNRVHFELIKRYTNREMGTGILRESYPTSKMFGIKAWTYPTIEDTINGVKNHFDIDITF